MGFVAVLLAACGRIGFDDRVAEADGGTAVQLVAHAIANTHGNGLTLSPIDTTGASLIVIGECTWSTGTPTVPNDSANNNWQSGLGTYGSNTSPANIKLFYTDAPITSSVHTFTDTGDDFLAMAVLAFAGTLDTPNVLDSATGGSGANPFRPGSVTPSQLGQLVVTVACSGESVAATITIDPSFDLVGAVLNHDAGGPEDIGAAFTLATSTSAIDPTWTFAGDSEVAAAIAAFSHP